MRLKWVCRRHSVEHCGLVHVYEQPATWGTTPGADMQKPALGQQALIVYWSERDIYWGKRQVLIGSCMLSQLCFILSEIKWPPVKVELVSIDYFMFSEFSPDENNLKIIFRNVTTWVIRIDNHETFWVKDDLFGASKRVLWQADWQILRNPPVFLWFLPISYSSW